jgi:hypothetical protein
MSAELVRYGPGTVEYEVALAPQEERLVSASANVFAGRDVE